MFTLVYKLLAIDLDDTLLQPDLTIAAESMKTIKKAREKGVMVTLATGRMYCSALPYARQLEIEVPLISYQGALVKNIRSKQILYYKPLPRVDARQIMGFFQGRGVHYHTYYNDQLCVEKITPEVEDYMRLAGVKPVIMGDLAKALSHHQALKVLAVHNHEEQLLAMEAELQATYGSRLYITRSKPFFLEIMHPQATKVEALQYLARYYQIKPAEIMAIGDSYNDLAMIEWAGLGVAMGNARETVKKAADDITTGNEADGVAEAIKKHILRA